MKMTSQILAVADVYCRASARSRARVSTLVFNRGSKLDDIASGADLNTASFERAMVWFSGHWPDDLAWPDGIERPVVPSCLIAQSRESTDPSSRDKADRRGEVGS